MPGDVLCEESMEATWKLRKFSLRPRSALGCGALTFLEKLYVGMGGYDIANVVV